MEPDRKDAEPRVETEAEKHKRFLLQILCRLEEAAQAKAINFKDFTTKEVQEFWRQEKSNVRNRQIDRHRKKMGMKASKELFDSLNPGQREALGLPVNWNAFRNRLMKEEAHA